MKTTRLMLVAVVSAIVLGGCAYPRYGSADYGPYGVRGEQEVRFGVVDSVRPVRIQAPDSGVGTFTGATIGSVAGSHVGGGSGQFVGAVAGMVLGGLLGQAIEQDANARTGLEITVLLDNGKYLAITQEGDEQFRNGDRVRVLSGRGGARVTH